MSEQYTDIAQLSPEELEEAKAMGLIDDDPEPQEPTADPDPAPVPPEEDETGEAEETDAPEEEPAPDDKRTVPLKALHEEREKRKKLQAEAEEQRKRYLEAVEQNRQAAVKLAEFAERTVPKPEPEEVDPLEAMIQAEVQKRISPIEQRFQAQAQAHALQERIDTCEAQVKQQFTDYDEVTKPVFEELTRAAAAAQSGDQQAAAWLNSILHSPNPPLAAYIHGQTRRMAQGTAPTPQAPTAPQTKTPPVLPRATGGGNGTGQAMTAERLAAMSTEDFDAWCTKHPKEARALMGG